MQKRRWLVAMIETAEIETVILPWSRARDRKRRKAAARARAIAA
ncbi:MAG: hypothetical protein R3D80_20410 [Paracoccaceae bacterium]